MFLTFYVILNSSDCDRQIYFRQLDIALPPYDFKPPDFPGVTSPPPPHFWLHFVSVIFPPPSAGAGPGANQQVLVDTK